MKKEATTCNHQSLAIILMALAILILGGSVAFGATYRIEPGDKLLISVFGQSDYDQTVTVREDGKISYFGGDLSVADKTPEEVNQLVYDRLSQQAHLKNPLIIVSPIPSEKEIFVSGAVNQPGRYPLRLQDEIGLEWAIAIAGGFDNRADLKDVQVVRQDGSLEVYDISPDKPYQPVVVKGGDLVRVPALGVVDIQGQVKEPGKLLIRGQIQIDEALARTGGPNENADLAGLVIISAAGKKTKVSIDERFWEMTGEDNGNYFLKDGDVLFVPSAYKMEPIYVLGYARNPGAYKIRNPITPMQAIALAGGTDVAANLEKVIITRKDETIHKINLNPENNQNEGEPKILLDEGDMLFIPKRGQINWSLILSFISVTSVVVSLLIRN